ncbi:PAK4-inhibitor INKA1 [Plecturocebus cupreus]
MPDVGAAAAAGATESEEPRSQAEAEGAAGRLAQPSQRRSAGVPTGAGRLGGDLGTDMHSARLDSFLSQLRWELGGGGAAHMAQMARVEFRTVGNCAGHQLCGRDTGSPPMPGSLQPTPQTGPDVQPSHQFRASGTLEEDSVCVEEEEEEEAVVTEDRSAALGGPREQVLDWDSGFSEVSGSTWREEELPVPQRPAPSAQPLHRQRLSVSGLPMAGRTPVASAPPSRHPRPKSTPDACLEHWQGLEAEDWTAALLSRGRSRQPLILGDNCFADLVHNWMELPETGSEGGDGGGPRARARPPQFLLGLSEQLRRRLARARRTAMAGKRLSCPPRPETELPTDVSRFAALMSCRSRQPIICNDVSYL